MGLFSTITDLAIPGMTEGYNDQVNRDAFDYKNYVQGLSPESLKSQFSGLSTDPGTRQTQMQALQQLGMLAKSNGNDPQAAAMMFDANRQAAAEEQSKRNAILQNASARGVGGSGTEIAGLLAAQQGGADRSHAGGVQAAADSRGRALAALGQLGSMAGQVRGQDWGEAAQKAGALDQFALGRYGAEAGKAGLLGGAYGFDKGVQNQNAARAAGQAGSWGSALDSLGSFAGGFGGSAPKANPYDLELDQTGGYGKY